MKKLSLIVAVLLFVPMVMAQTDANTQGVHDAVLDYVEGLYDVQPDRIERSVSKELVKYGYWKARPDEEFAGEAMNFDQLKDLAAKWNVDNRNRINEDSPKTIEVFDVLSKMASAKVTAVWGVDYLLLEKSEGKWMIRQVLWQGPLQTT